MEKVWINKGRPKTVIEKNEVHYFYWPLELGIGATKILGRVIPLPLPMKFSDYEPIQVIKIKGQRQVLSRFHYKILTYFNRPKIIKKRPIVDFTFGSHSPYVHSKPKSRLGASITPLEKLSATDADFILALILIYSRIVSGKIRLATDQMIDYNVEDNKIPDDALFKPSKCHSVVWVGKHPEKNKSPSDVWNILSGK